MHLLASLLLLVVGLPCIQYAECVSGEVTQEAAASSGMPASQPWCSSVEQCSIQCQQLQQKAILHNIQYPEVLVPVTWAVLQAGTTICLFAAVAALVSLLWQRAADKARFRARELQLQASCRGTREEALNLGSLAALWAKQNRALTGQNNLLSQEVLAHREAQQQLQVGTFSILASLLNEIVPASGALLCVHVHSYLCMCCSAQQATATMPLVPRQAYRGGRNDFQPRKT